VPKNFQSAGAFLTFAIYVSGFIVVAAVCYNFIRLWLKNEAKQRLLNQVKTNNVEEYVLNFINRFGQEHPSKHTWAFREHAFTWDRLEDFRKILNEKGVTVSTQHWDDTTSLLRHYIQQMEEKITRDSVQLKPKQFSLLSPAEFETLLVRLFTAMGYTVQHSGKTGDQGCDLILNSAQTRYIVQAKRYNVTVGNDAIQQAVAAQKFYDCNKSMVVTNSSFTNEAVALAKANNVDLVNTKLLNELLLQYLKESWS
jgi:HJR/Mrr/RecB family endonuclease